MNVVHIPRRLSVSSTPIQRTIATSERSPGAKISAPANIQIASVPSKLESMPIKTFEFSSVDCRRFVKPTDRWLNLRVDHNSTVTLISELGDRQASVDFRFTANYHASEAVVGLIQIEGNLLWEGDARGLVKSWSAGGQMPPEVAQEIHTVIMSNCIPEAVILARELRLPPPVPIPQVNVPQQPPKPGKGRSPEIA